MKKNLINKGFVLAIMVCFVVAGVVPVVNAQFIKTMANKTSGFNVVNDDEKVKIKVYSCKAKGTIEKNVTMISKDEAIELKNRLEDTRKTGGSFLEMYEEQLGILKEAGIIPADVALDSILEDVEEIDGNRSYARNMLDNGPLSDSNCLIGFMGVGIGFPIGSHSVSQTIGADIVVLCAGLFYVMTLALGAENAKFTYGFLAGFCLVFLGFLIVMLVPEVYGPVVIGIGYTLFTHWTPFI